MPSDAWNDWTYADWNNRLVSYCFGDDATEGTQAGLKVSRLAATPEELRIVVSDDNATSDAVVDRFVEIIKQELPHGRKSFSGYCLDNQCNEREWPREWTPESPNLPHFFAMLWFTCLVAYGHPDATVGFHDRLDYLILGKHDSLEALPRIWESFRDWTRYQATKGRRIRELALPPKDTFRTVIGYSYYLAFPHQSDRRILAAVLANSNLTEIDPPVRLTLDTLEQNRKQFSKYFNEDLDNFINEFLRSHKDPRNSAFWRAVRQEAIRPSLSEFCTGPAGGGRITILAQWTDDETLCPLLACTPDYAPPNGYIKQPLQDPIAEFTHEVTTSNGSDPTSTVNETLDNPQVLPSGLRLAILQGIVPLIEVTNDEFQIATGGDITGCDLALVREDQVQSFVTLYGGSFRESAIQGWLEIEKCQIYQLDVLSPLIPAATILLNTSDSRSPHFVGGVRASSSSYYRLPEYMPVVRAPKARSVDVVLANRRLGCIPIASDVTESVDWSLPQDVAENSLIQLLIEAEWIYDLKGTDIVHRSTCQCKIVEWNFRLDYKNVPLGHYWQETCARAMNRLEGPIQEVSTGLTTQCPLGIADLIRLDETARWLGPGIGEMSCIERPEYQWLTIGPKNRPEFLVFVGDKSSPRLPEMRWSVNKSDQRHWRKAFSNDVPAYVLQDNNFVDISKVNTIRTVHKEYRRATRMQRGSSGQFFQSVSLGDLAPPKAYGVEEVNPSIGMFGEVLSVLANNRSRVSLREFHDHLGRLTKLESSHLLRQQIARAWAETGCIDLLQRQDGRQTIVAARRPRFVVFRRGPKYCGTLMGLLPKSLNSELTRVAARLQIQLTWRRSAHKFQPFVASISCDSAERIHRVSDDLGFTPPEFLDWPSVSTLPIRLRVEGNIIRDDPPKVYERDARWCVVQNSFTRMPKDTGRVIVERRTDGRRAPIYVLLGPDGSVAWSYSRTWALLSAAELGNEPPFQLNHGGILRSIGKSPQHLPMPLARLCAVAGVGLPGPETETSDGGTTVRGYAYPFGSEIAKVVRSSVPRRWILEDK